MNNLISCCLINFLTISSSNDIIILPFYACNAIVPDVIAFVTSQGRMKYVRPLYRALMQSKSGRDIAVVTFMKSKNM